MRYLPILVALVVPAIASAQSDSVPSPATSPAAADTSGGFRPGQWGVRFISDGGVYGAGAVYFTSPRSAWLLEAYLDATYLEQYDASLNAEQATLLGGKRWYGERHGRVRSIVGVGGLAGFGRVHYAGSDESDYSYAVGAYGEVGAAVFFTPHMSLGATWRAMLTATYLDQASDQTYYDFSAGPMAIEGAFYF